MSGARGTRSRTTLVSLCAAVLVIAVTAALIVSQSGVTGAEKEDSAEFTVAGDGELPTKRPSLGESRDPLSTEETGYAIQIASTDPTVPAGATNVRGETGPEFLYAELPDDVDSAGRSALVVLYDYTDDKTYHQLVNLTSGKVPRSQSVARLQPPLSPDEAKEAITLAIDADPPLPFSRQFEDSEGVPLVSTEQVNHVAGAWTYDNIASRGKECGADRCAHLFVKTASGTYLGTQDFVVNLSTGRIVKLAAKS